MESLREELILISWDHVAMQILVQEVWSGLNTACLIGSQLTPVQLVQGPQFE